MLWCSLLWMLKKWEIWCPTLVCCLQVNLPRPLPASWTIFPSNVCQGHDRLTAAGIDLCLINVGLLLNLDCRTIQVWRIHFPCISIKCNWLPPCAPILLAHLTTVCVFPKDLHCLAFLCLSYNPMHCVRWSSRVQPTRLTPPCADSPMCELLLWTGVGLNCELLVEKHVKIIFYVNENVNFGGGVLLCDFTRTIGSKHKISKMNFDMWNLELTRKHVEIWNWRENTLKGKSDVASGKGWGLRQLRIRSDLFFWLWKEKKGEEKKRREERNQRE